MDGQLRKAILAKADMETLEDILKTKGHADMLEAGNDLVERGITTQDEVNKVCGIISE